MRKFLPSFSQSLSLSLPVLFLIASKTWQGSACFCFPKWMGSQLLARAFLSSGIGCSNTLFIGLWDYPISCKIQQKQQQLCACVFLLLPSSGRSTPALTCLHWLSGKYRTDLKTFLSSGVWDMNSTVLSPPCLPHCSYSAPSQAHYRILMAAT